MYDYITGLSLKYSNSLEKHSKVYVLYIFLKTLIIKGLDTQSNFCCPYCIESFIPRNMLSEK